MGLHVIVLAGGSGTRLWPLSRQAFPKHLLPIGPGGTTLLRATVERVLGLGDKIHVVTAAGQADLCRAAVEGLAGVDIIAEPMPRGTGPALGLATMWIARGDPEAVISSVHADHYVGDTEAYRAAVVAAAGWAHTTKGLATVGLVPTHPATGLGYVQLGAPRHSRRWTPAATRAIHEGEDDQARGLPAFVSPGFVEKPALELAERFVEERTHLWNLGLFAWTATSFTSEVRSADAEIDGVLAKVIAARAGGDDALAADLYATLPTIAVEPLVFERTPVLTVVRVSFAWSDLGSWHDLAAVQRTEFGVDPGGNLVVGDGLALDSRNCSVFASGGRTVAVLGADDLVVVDTEDAVLVVPRDRVQAVKELIEALRAAGRDDLL